MTGSLVEVLPSACAVLGDQGFSDSLDLRNVVGDVRRLVVLVADGLGYHLIDRSPPLASLAGQGTLGELSCTLPSTTPTSLVSFGTGAVPGEHGVLGFTVNLPGTDQVLTHIAWRNEPNPSQWQPILTVFERSELRSAVVQPAEFVGSGLTRAAYRGADLVGLKSGAPLARQMLRTLGESDLVVGYVAAVDTAAHVYGIASEHWQHACAEVAVMVEQLADGLPGDAALLVTADHGGLDIPPDRRVDLGRDERLSAGLRVVAGEPRMRYLHTRDGATADVMAAWQEVLADRVEVLTRDEAIATGMFGAVTDPHRARIGDVVVVCRDDTAVLATGWDPDIVSTLVGMHGATTPAETAIPLLTLTPTG